MKKRVFVAGISLFMCFIMMFIFTACESESPTESSDLLENTEKLVVIKASKTGGSVEDALKAYKEAGELEYEGDTGDYGFYLISVNGYVPDAQKNEFWALYTTLGEYEGVTYSDTEFGEYEYNGTVCASASYGISGMPLVEGELYILTVSSY